MAAEEKQVRSFTLSDVPLLRRLAPLGVSLDTVTELTRGVNPINEAFLASLPVGQLGMPTYVLRDRDAQCLGLLRHRESAPLAYIAYVAPDLAKCPDETRWIALIEGLVQAAGERGAHVLNAEVDPSGQTFEALREVGFALFARQEIWKWRGDIAVGETGALLQSFSDIDTVGVTALYVNIVPKLVQQAIPPPSVGDQGFVFSNRDGHAIGHFTVFRGQRGTLLRPLLHPEAYDEAAALIIGVLAKLMVSERVPVYCVVHNYQEWLREPLRAAGFELWARQVVMGKYTLRRVADPALQPAAAHGTRPLSAATELKNIRRSYED